MRRLQDLRQMFLHTIPCRAASLDMIYHGRLVPRHWPHATLTCYSSILTSTVASSSLWTANVLCPILTALGPFSGTTASIFSISPDINPMSCMCWSLQATMTAVCPLVNWSAVMTISIKTLSFLQESWTATCQNSREVHTWSLCSNRVWDPCRSLWVLLFLDLAPMWLWACIRAVGAILSWFESCYAHRSWNMVRIWSSAT